MNKFQNQRIAVTTRGRHLVKTRDTSYDQRFPLTLGVNYAYDENDSKMKGHNKTNSEIKKNISYGLYCIFHMLWSIYYGLY